MHTLYITHSIPSVLKRPIIFYNFSFFKDFLRRQSNNLPQQQQQKTFLLKV